MSQLEAAKRNIPGLNALVRSLVEQETLEHPFWVSGFVVRPFVSDAGHLYFRLEYDGYSIHCMIRTQVRNSINFEISGGMEVEVLGSIRVYERKAEIQLDIEQVKLVRTEKQVVDTNLLDQLTQKGLWPREKKPMPNVTRRIGLITSKQSDALHDFEDTYRSEGGLASVKLADVRLQGDQAPQVIADAIRRLGKSGDVDVIVLTRGGGRSAELAIFDSLLIAEAICCCPIPVVTGIGHQRDRTLADEVADYAAITPTAIASFLARIKAQELPHQPATSDTNNRALYFAMGVILVAVIIILVLLLTR